MTKELDDRLNRLEADAGKPVMKKQVVPIVKREVKSEVTGEEPMTGFYPMDVLKNPLLQGFQRSINQGMVVQIYRKKGKIIMEESPVFSKWLMRSILINVMLLALLITKSVGLW